MKFVVDLPEDTPLKPGTVLHTFGYPEPEIFGFLYVHPDRVASLGIFVPSWFDSPVRTAYRYLQHWMLHPYLWRYLKGGKLRSWGAKTLGESGRRGEPHLAGDGYARIGEGSGTHQRPHRFGRGRGLGHRRATRRSRPGIAQGEKTVHEGKSRSNLRAAAAAPVGWRHEARIAEKSRDGFQPGVVTGLIGMALAGLSGGRLALPGEPRRRGNASPPWKNISAAAFPPGKSRRIRDECYARGVPLHAALMERAGWPAISYDGQLLVSHQDALLLAAKCPKPLALCRP